MSTRLLRLQTWEELALETRFQPAALASRCGVSLRHLERFFLTATGQNLSQWLRSLRFRHAIKLLSEGYKTEAVAADLGFANSSHFCHEFKKFHGVPPQSFAPGGTGPQR